MAYNLRQDWLRLVCSAVVAAGSSHSALLAQHTLHQPANGQPAVTNCAPAVAPQRIIVNVPQPEVIVNQTGGACNNVQQQQANCGLFGKH